MPTWVKRFALVIAAILVLTFTPMLSGSYAWAQTQRIERGAIYGGAAGLLFGDGLGGALTGCCPHGKHFLTPADKKARQ